MARTRPYLSALCVMTLALALVLALSARPAAAQPSWENRAELPDGEEEVMGTAVGDHVYAMVGLESLWQPMGINWRYDTTADAWQELDPMPEARHHPGLAAVEHPDGVTRIHVVAGYDAPGEGPPPQNESWRPNDDHQVFNTESLEWEEGAASYPIEVGALACEGLDGRLHCAGGATLPEWSDAPGVHPSLEVVHPNDHYVYDPEENAWEEAPPIPTARNHFSMTAVDGRIYAIGGRVGHAFVRHASAPAVANEVFDPEAGEDGRWEPRAPMPTPRSAHDAALVEFGTAGGSGAGRSAQAQGAGRGIHVIGGEVFQPGEAVVHSTHEVYDPDADTWTRSIPIGMPRHGLVVAAVGNELYAISGANVAGGGGPHVALGTNERLVIDHQLPGLGAPAAMSSGAGTGSTGASEGAEGGSLLDAVATVVRSAWAWVAG